jgi:hypothetical protein
MAQRLCGFITDNSIIDHVEIAHAVLGDEEVDDPMTLAWMTLAWTGREVYAVTAGLSALDAVASLACTKVFSGHPCPNCNKTAVLYDGLTDQWTYGGPHSRQWGEWVCAIFFDEDLGDWRRACMKQDEESPVGAFDPDAAADVRRLKGERADG